MISFTICTNEEGLPQIAVVSEFHQNFSRIFQEKEFTAFDIARLILIYFIQERWSKS